MKTAKAVILFLVVLAGAAVAADASAHGRYRGGYGGVRLGVFVGAPAFGFGYYPGYYGSPYYYGNPYYYGAPYNSGYYPYYPRAAVEPAYVEQGGQAQAPAQGLQPGYWYYCRESSAYYPHVNQCAGRWEQVAPTPPSQ